MQILRWSTISDRILILGAGRLARSLIERLPTSRDVAVCRRSFFSELWPGSVMWSTFGKKERLRQILRAFRPNRVIICWAPGRGGEHRETYLTGMLDFIHSVSGVELDQVIYTSSSAVIEGEHGDWIEGDGILSCPKGERAKNLWEAEEALANWGKDQRVSTLILRLSGLYGRGAWPGRRLLEKGEEMSKPAGGWVNLIHLDDAAEAVKLGLEKTVEGSWVVSSGPVLRKTLYEATAKSLGLSPPSWPSGLQDLGKKLDGGGYLNKSGLTLKWSDPLEWVKSQGR